MLRMLRVVYLTDALVLGLLGLLLVLAPVQAWKIFQFQDLPAGVNYIVGMWGALMATMGLGYWLASTDPSRNLLFAKVGIARGILEVAIGLIYILNGTITWGQGWFGLVMAGWFALAYAMLIPRVREELAGRTA